MSDSSLDHPGLPAPKTGNIWHLSDLHFDPENLPGVPDDKAGTRSELFTIDPYRQLVDYARTCRADLLILSGDFVDAPAVHSPPRSALVEGSGEVAGPLADLNPENQKRRDAFQVAARFIRRLAKAHGLHEDMGRRVVVCPGNHDVDWALALTEPRRSLESFSESMSDFLSHDSDPPLVTLPELGITVFAVDTAFLGGTEFHRIARGLAVQIDAAGFATQRIAAIMKRESRGSEPAVPATTLGIVVAHHPPTVTPTTAAEIKPFEIPVGAAQAKRMLFLYGFRAFLHGHKHFPVTVREEVYLGPEDLTEDVLVIGAGALGNAGDKWFNVIRYAVSPLTGEARILVQPHSFADFTPRKVGEKLFYVAPRTRSAASMIRIVERINPNGDSRLDCEYRDIPVLEGNRVCGGWVRENGRYVRCFQRVEAADDDVSSHPMVRALTPHATAEVIGLAGDQRQRANRSFQIKLQVPLEPVVKYASFAVRSFVNGTYAVSRYHQRRISGSAQAVPCLPPGWDGYLHVMRDPAERLEISIQMPFALDREYQVEVLTLVEDENGALSQAEDLLRFATCRIEKNFPARRVSVSIQHPLVGVGYLVRWELPEFDPAISPSGKMDESYLDGLQWAEEIRKSLLDAKADRTSPLPTLLTEIVNRLSEELIAADGLSTQDEAEWAIFVPESSILDHDNDQQPKSLSRPILRPVFANFPTSDPRWEAAIPAGNGLVGRAYALNAQVRYFGARSGKMRKRPRNGWTDPEIHIYARVEGSLDHSVLYALPLHVPGREADIVWGVICIGTEKQRPKLNLEVPIDPNPLAPGPRASEGSLAVMSALNLFTRRLIRWIHSGIGMDSNLHVQGAAESDRGAAYLPPWSYVGGGAFVRTVPTRAFSLNEQPLECSCQNDSDSPDYGGGSDEHA